MTAASSIVQVEVLVYSSKTIRHISLEAWLDPAQKPQIEAPAAAAGWHAAAAAAVARCFSVYAIRNESVEAH